MRTHITYGLIGLALTVGVLWPSEANAQYRPRPGVGMLAPPPPGSMQVHPGGGGGMVAPSPAPRRLIGGYARPIMAPAAPHFSPGVTMYSQIPSSRGWNFNQYAPFFTNYGYNGFYPPPLPPPVFTPYYSPYAGLYSSYYGNGFYYGY